MTKPRTVVLRCPVHGWRTVDATQVILTAGPGRSGCTVDFTCPEPEVGYPDGHRACWDVPASTAAGLQADGVRLAGGPE